MGHAPITARATVSSATGLEVFIANGNQIGTVNAQGVVVADFADGIVTPNGVVANNTQIGTAALTPSSTSSGVSQAVSYTSKVTRSVGFFLLGLGFDYMLSNRLSVGITGDVSFAAKKTYRFAQGDSLFASAPSVSIRPTYVRMMVTFKYSLN